MQPDIKHNYCYQLEVDFHITAYPKVFIPLMLQHFANGNHSYLFLLLLFYL